MVYVSSWPRGLKRQRSIHPNQDRLFVSGIEPAVADIALEPKVVALLKDTEFQLVQPEFKAAVQHVNGTTCTPASSCRWIKARWPRPIRLGGSGAFGPDQGNVVAQVLDALQKL